jgi:cell division transport system permease protein
MITALRLHRYALGLTLRRFAREPGSTLGNVLVLALALTVPLLGLAAWISLQPVARQLASDPEITIFMKVDAGRAAAEAIVQRLRDDEARPVSVRLVSRESALEDLRANPVYREALSVLPSNPLPDAVIIRVEAEDLAQRSPAWVARWKAWPGVDQVVLDTVWVQRLEALLRFLATGVLFLAVVVAAAVVATVFNTVRMQALSQREEIAVARLVGATESFVRRPFIYQGLITGLASAGVALGLTAVVLMPLNAALADLVHSYGGEFSLRLPEPALALGFVLGTALLAALAARFSVTRHTRY